MKLKNIIKSFFQEGSTDLIIGAPSQKILGRVVLVLFLSILAAGVSSFYISIDQSAISSGLVILENGPKPAVATTSGHIYQLEKKINDTVKKDEVIGAISFEQIEASELVQLKNSLEIFSQSLESSFKDPGLELKLPSLYLEKASQSDMGPFLIEIEKEFYNLMGKRKNKMAENKIELNGLLDKKQKLEKNLIILKNSKNAKLLEFQIVTIENELNEIKLLINDRKNITDEKLEDSFILLQRNLHLATTKINDLLKKHQIKSPVDGVIVKIENNNQSYVVNGNPVLWIVSSKDSLVAEIHMHTSYLGKINSGANLFFKLEAYPYTKFGTFEGKVTWIETPQSDSIARDYFIIRSTINLPKNMRRPASNGPIKLKPGMKFQASVILNRKKIIDIIKEKIFN